jgi:hypothetical protein
MVKSLSFCSRPGADRPILEGMAAAHDLPDFDPRIIERYVETTYRKATAIFIGSVTAGVMIGAAFGATPLTSLGSSWPIPKIFGFATMLSGAFIGGLIGYIVGDTRSFMCRLQGQTALAQVETAINSRRALEQLEAIEAVTRRLRTAPPRPAAPVEVKASSRPAVQPVEPPVAVPVPQLRVAGSQDVPPPPLSPTPVQ